ncbi:MAG: Oligosaccharide translocation protein rft1 [Heterodermia speciosa]|uniref:Man(5)GlcNAc(2)-PP-dolichol translocation protein RFT1 n=1 Tax=Heterodermia speciosa TaxID=116794 RepID=A0A8H3FY82_9LECA|nr:MAG: Oligosaccharide translocation protein rft1 [Heterodermia speciosa]
MSESSSPSSLLAKSANGATLLVLLRIGSRLATFALNQVLLRFLAPEVLGISTQLDLFATSILSFACESLRVALQRQRLDGTQETVGGYSKSNGKGQSKRNPATEIGSYGRRAQETVNLSYIAIAIGVPLAYALATVYLNSADPAVLNAPYFNEALHGYIIATILELLNEPSFAIAQQQMLYSTRASAEASATFVKCVVTCSLAIWASRTNTQLGVLPFAFGQIAYALVLNGNYLSKVITLAFDNDFSIALKSLPPSPQLYFSRFSKPLVYLAGNLYGQSILKQLLTNGDSYLIASFTSLSAQGSYALAANYGGLLARILFQPIEESSRSYFARLFASENLSLRKADIANDEKKGESRTKATSAPAEASQYLTTLLRAYILFSIFVATLGPTLSPLALRVIAGSRWAHTEAPAVLAAYCYYIPLLAINGILEAFVAATASPSQLRRQAVFMVAFSASFVASGYYVLKVLQRSGRGLVLASSVSMILRIMYSSTFIMSYLGRSGNGLKGKELLPGAVTAVGSLASAIALNQMEKSFEGCLMDFIKWTSIAGAFGMAA